MIERLFDIVQQRAAADPGSTLLAAKESGAWREYSAAEVWQLVEGLSGGLIRLGISNGELIAEAQEKIAIISPNRPEWLIADLAVQLCGAVLTPIYPTIAPGELRFILEQAGVKKVFVSGNTEYERFGEVLQSLGASVISFDEISGTTNWKSLLQDGSTGYKNIASRVNGDTLATIIYTSGTTGDPKGVMLTHSNIVSNVRDSMPAFTFAIKGDKALSFLPLNHIFEKMVTYIYLEAGLSIWYAESMEKIGDNLREVKPMVFTTVPRLLEKVYEKIMAKALELKGVKKSLFFWALNLGKKFDNRKSGGLFYNMQLGLANKLIFSKWREALGGRVKAIVTGSAACSEKLIRIFSSAGIVIMEGYGLTETSPVVSVNRFESDNRYVGSVGTLIENVQVKLAEDGEILVKGPNVMKGYYGRPDLTAEAIQDGWFHTGDIGEWKEGKFLKLTDRKKEIFKTSGGKYVAPQAVENKMRESPYIEQIMVIGSNRKYVSALIVPSYMQVRNWLKERGIVAPAGGNEALIAMPEVHRLIREQLDKYNASLGHVEQVKKFTLLPQEWTVDTGELTPSLKLKRKVVEKGFGEEIEGMYDANTADA